MIYLASPYSDPDLNIMQERYDLTFEACVELIKKEEIIFSPIVYCHPMAALYNLPRDFPFWQSFNHHMISLSSEFRILKLNGWQTSRGIKDDTAKASSEGIRITHITLEECIS